MFVACIASCRMHHENDTLTASREYHFAPDLFSIIYISCICACTSASSTLFFFYFNSLALSIAWCHLDEFDIIIYWVCVRALNDLIKCSLMMVKVEWFLYSLKYGNHGILFYFLDLLVFVTLLVSLCVCACVDCVNWFSLSDSPFFGIPLNGWMDFSSRYAEYIENCKWHLMLGVGCKREDKHSKVLDDNSNRLK